MVIVLSTSLIISNVTAAIPQTSRHCTSTYPCNYKVCGDHICASGEYDQLRTKVIEAQKGGSTAPSNMTLANMTTTIPLSGTVKAGVVSYIDQASDGTIVLVRTSHPTSGQPLPLGIGFFTADRNYAIQHQNYAITVIQDNVTVFSHLQGYTQTGYDTLTTTLSSSDPIRVEVTLNGVGLPSADPSTWTGVKGEVLDFLQGPEDIITAAPVQTPVPEFGPVASIVLAIAVLSIVLFTAKTRTIPRL